MNQPHLPTTRGPKLRRKLPTALLTARQKLRADGWTYRTAAPALGCCWQHLALVLTGRRESRSLLARIAAMPPRYDNHRAA